MLNNRAYLLEKNCILHSHVERASCLHYMARSRRQGSFALLPFDFHLDRVRSAIGWHLGVTFGVCMPVWHRGHNQLVICLV